MDKKIISIIFLIVIGVLLGLLVIFNPEILFFILAVFIIYRLIYKKFGVEEKKFLLIVFTLALAIRIILSFAYYRASLAKGCGVDFMGDATNYSNNALYIAEVITKKDFSKYLNKDPYLAENVQIARKMFDNKLPPLYIYQVGPYSYYIGFLYTIFGYVPFLIKLFNCLFGSLLSLVVYLIAKELFTVKAGKVAMLITAFFPSLLFWSITGLRDIILIVAITSCFWLLTKFQNKIKFLYFVLFGLLLFIISNFKRNIVAVLAISFFMQVFIYKLKFIGKLIVISILMLVSLQILFNPDSRINKIVYRQLQELRADAVINSQVVNTYRARSGYMIYPERFYLRFIYSLPDKDIKNVRPEEFMFGAFLGMLYFLFSPFLWHMPNISELITYPQMIIWYFLIIFSIPGFFIAFRYKRSKALGIIIFCVLMVVLNSLVEGNRGTMFRHRDILTPFILIFSSVGICRLFDLDVIKEDKS